MLTCETIQELLPLVVNGQLPAEDEGIVVLHLAVCEACDERTSRADGIGRFA